jgi:N-glycosylase/DNA lyase
MKYQIEENKIIIFGKEDFNPKHILECGQVFSFNEEDGNYVVFPQNKFAKILENDTGYQILTKDTSFFEGYFDLKRDYSKIKTALGQFEILKNPIEFGHGIRILKQDLFEMLISFIVSANNNIKRIKLILGRLREKLGEKIENGYAFPSLFSMREQSEEFYKEIGSGYRAPYLAKVVWQIDQSTLENWKSLSTENLRKNLLSLYGVGPKVADCILLFGYGRGDVFPVDTWIHQMFNTFYPPLENREQIRNKLVNQFGELSGYAQQYLFYYQRSNKNK